MKQGWEVKKLGDVCIFERGLTYAKGDEVTVSSKGVLRSNNVDLSSNTLNFDEIKYLREDFEIPTKKKVKKNCLLMCMSNGSKIHLGKVALVDKDIDFAFGGFMGLLTPNEGIIHPKYLYYVLISPAYKSLIKNLSDGANINNLKFADLKSFNISVPSIEEQQRIVDILDKEFEKIDTLKANAEKGLQQAKDLFQSALKQELQPKDGWMIKSLDMVSTFSQGVQVEVGKQFTEKMDGFMRFLRIVDFTQGNEPPRYVDIIDERYQVKKDSLSVVRYGASAGFICTGQDGVIANNIFKIEPKRDTFISNAYLYYVLISDIFQSVIRKNVNGAAMPALSFGMIKDVNVPYPSIQEQNQIVIHLDKLKKYSNALQANYEKTIALCDDMKQALLRKAFNGEF